MVIEHSRTLVGCFLVSLVLAGVSWLVARVRRFDASQYAEEKPFAKELLVHIDNLYHQRVNLFFVAESIFFVAVSTVPEVQRDLRFMLCCLAATFTLLLWYTLSRLRRAFGWLRDVVSESSELYREYRSLGSRFGAGVVFTYGLPTITLTSWLYFAIWLGLEAPPMATSGDEQDGVGGLIGCVDAATVGVVVAVVTLCGTVAALCLVWRQLGLQIFSVAIGWAQAEDIRATRGRLYTLKAGVTKKALNGYPGKRAGYEQDADRVAQIYNSIGILLLPKVSFISRADFLGHHSRAIYLCWLTAEQRIRERRLREKKVGLWKSFELLKEKAERYLRNKAPEEWNAIEQEYIVER